MAEKPGEKKQLQFAPFNSALDAGFWHKLSEKKLDEYGLDDALKPLQGYFFNGDPAGLPCRVNLDFNAFEQTPRTPPRCFYAHGALKNMNTMDEFKTGDKQTLLNQQGQKMWDAIQSGDAIKDPSLLARFLLFTFADLKKYHYYYIFAFPALCAPEVITLATEVKTVAERFTEAQLSSFVESYDTRCLPQQTAFFLVRETDNGQLVTGQLAEFSAFLQTGSKVMLGVCDPCTLEAHPGWPVRNLLTLAAYHWADQLNNEVEVICFRDRFKDAKRNISHSLVLRVHLPSIASLTECPKCVGWEKNERQKIGPRTVNLSSSMDPARLAESAVDLNLKLMRWRLLPDLDLEKISSTRCLLLGSGTLGCNVARALLGWGIRNITLVDNGKVSYSNPVRQSLFVFDDSLHGGKEKATAAAEGLKRIFPGVNAEGIHLSIPMPGHSVSESAIEQTKQEIQQLENLIDRHDVIFLLMDTRESRWLPTLLGATKGKIVMNAALGFDTFLVVRHGLKKRNSSAMDTEEGAGSSPLSPESAAAAAAASWRTSIPGEDLGCYFCNDVVAPGDSTRDRTLDQQCTVSRPGISMLASAYAVEMLVSLLVHPLGGYAPADTSATEDYLTKDAESPLGIVPHSMRGFLSRFHHVMPGCKSFDKCTACSETVMQHYEKEGFKFLLNVFNTPSYLEDLTGLSSLHSETLDDVWEFSDEENME